MISQNNLKLNVFVTCGSGFLGKSMIKKFVSEGHIVSALVRSEPSVCVH